MSQHDMDVANQTGALVRADFNNALLALVSNSSGASAPGTTFAFQFWLDTANNLLKCRNAANSAWVDIGTPSVSNLGLLSLAGGTLTGILLSAVGAVGAPGIAFDGDTDSGFYWVSDGTWGLVSNGVEYLRISPDGITFMGTGATTFASGTTAQRPTPVAGMVRYNSDLTVLEAYVDGSWKIIASSANYPFTVEDFADPAPVCSGRYHPAEFGGVSSRQLFFPNYPWTAPEKLSAQTSPAIGVGSSSVDVSPCGEFVALTGASSPYLAIYQKSGATWTKLANVSTLPTGDSNKCKFSPNGLYLAVAMEATPYVHVYKRAGATFTKLTNPSTLPAGAATWLDWSPNGEFLAVGHLNSPYISIYQFSGDTLTKIADPASLPEGDVDALAWSPDGRFLAYAAHVGVTIYGNKFYEITAGTTFTKVSTGLANSAANQVSGAAWSPDGEFYVHTNTGPTNYVNIYQRAGTTLTRLTSPLSAQPAGPGDGASWSPDGKYLAITHDTSPRLSIYERAGTTFTKLANPSTLPNGNCNDSVWSPDGQFLYIVGNTSPYFEVYQTGSEMADENVLTLKQVFRAGT